MNQAYDMVSVAHSPKGVAWVDRAFTLHTCEPSTFAYIRPNYPVPALIQCIEWWPLHQSWDDKAHVVGMEHHKPDRWRQWMVVS